jgi:hypothetical protein
MRQSYPKCRLLRQHQPRRDDRAPVAAAGKQPVEGLRQFLETVLAVRFVQVARFPVAGQLLPQGFADLVGAACGIDAEQVMPRMMKGMTVVLRPMPPAMPQEAILPQGWMTRVRPESMSPPTLSNAPAKRAEASGVSGQCRSWREMHWVAPSSCSQSNSSTLPEMARDLVAGPL